MTLSRRLLAAFVFVLGLATILGAWGFQIIGNYVPCELCLKERIPYYVGLPLTLIALIATVANAPAWVGRTLLGIAAIVFVCGVGLGLYHAGAEWAWWPGPTECGGGGSSASTTGDLLNQLNNIHVVSCTDAAFRFPAGWGLSFAGWNAVVSLVLAIAAAWGAATKTD